MSVITNKWNDESGDSISIESPSFQGNQTIKISSPVQKGTSKRSMQFIGKCKKDSSKQVILTVEQEASVYTYDLILSSDNTEIAAKGGTANITAILKTYRNGNLVSTDNVTPVLSGSATGFSISGVTVTASNRTTTAGNKRAIVVTGKYSNTFDGQTVLSTITIYQEANKIESYNYGSWNIGITANPTSLPATGGTSTITSSCTRSKTPVYTSGSIGTATSESATPILALTTNPGGFTLSGNKLTAANNPIGAKTATVTASYSGATSKSVSVTQAAGPDGIGYMQIQGDGTNHPIFRVGNTTRSIESTSVNQNSDITSDKDNSIFASLKQLLFKFI